MAPDRTVLAFNHAAETVFGLAAADAIGRDAIELLAAEEERDDLGGLLARLLESGSRTGGRFRSVGVRADGDAFPADVAFSLAELGETRVFVTFVRDLSEEQRAREELHRSKEQLEVILRNIEDGITVQDRTGALVYANDPAARLIGFASAEELMAVPADEILGRFEMIDEERRPFPLERLPGRRALAGEEVGEALIGYRRAGSKRTMWSKVSASPIRDGSGTPVLVINVFRDVTEEVERAERRRIVAEANRVLGSSLELEATIVALSDLLVPAVADWCQVDLLEEDGSLAPVTLVHSDPELRSLAERLRDSAPVEIQGAMRGKVARTGRPELVPRITGAMLSELPPEAARIVGELGVSAVLCVPLRVGDRTIGTLTLAASRGQRFGTPHVEVAQEVADRAAVAIDNARLFREHQAMARTLQRSLLPASLPRSETLEMAARYAPLGRSVEVGGDFYDVVRIEPGVWALFLGDVEGKGVAAAASVGIARHTVRTAARDDPSPAHVLPALNRALLEEDTTTLCTIAYAVLRPRSGPRSGVEVQVALAGHPPPLLLASDRSPRPLGVPSPPLGAFEELEVEEERVALCPGETVLLYSDGIALPGLDPHRSVVQLLGEEDAPLESLLDALVSGVTAAHPDGLRDDLSLLAVRARAAERGLL